MTNQDVTLPLESAASAPDILKQATAQRSSNPEYHYATEYQTGQDNIRVIGRDIHISFIGIGA